MFASLSIFPGVWAWVMPTIKFTIKFTLYSIPIMALGAVGLYIRLLPLYERAVKRVGDHVGFRSLISPFSGAGFGTPEIRGIYQGFDMPWREKYKVFQKWGSDVISSVSWTGRSVIYLADADLVQRINGNAKYFPKPVEEYTVLNFFGPNLVTAIGKDWRRQFNVSKDVFNSNGMSFLWDETRSIVDDMMESNGWNNLRAGEEIVSPHVVDQTLRIALLAIGNAGFGMHMTWKDDPNAFTASGRKMSFQSALHIVAQESILKMAIPKWCYKLPIPRLRKVRTAFTELGLYIDEMIVDRKAAILGASELAASGHDTRYDLFHNLVKASMTGEEALTDAELKGNIYIYLLAGHETTAHSIAFTFGLLAMNSAAQEKLYQHVMKFMPEDGVTDYEQFFPIFDYVKAVYFETLRMFPPVQQIPKIMAYDTMLVMPETNAHNVELGLAREAQMTAAAEDGTEAPSAPATASLDSERAMHAASSSTVTLPTPTRLASSDSISSVASSSSSAESSSDSDSILNMSPTLSNSSFSSVEEEKEEACAVESPVVAVSLSVAVKAATPTEEKAKVTLPPWTRSTTATFTDRTPAAPTVLPGQKALLVEKDTVVFVDPPAVHYNPKYYPEPYEFKPERFIGAYDEKAFIPFSSGTRTCLGRRFSEVESVVVIAYMIREFSIHPVPLRNRRTGAVVEETREEMTERMFRATPKITLTPHEMPIMFRKRRDGSGVAKAE